MTKDFDKTMDDLLRRHGRRGEPSFADAHLDADALSAFVENALPAAARLRYMTHLADCGACRKIAVDLTLAAGATFQEESLAAVAAPIKPPTASETESSWRSWFTAFFNPAVLRFAVPAVALFVVTVGAFLALRTAQKDGAAVQVAQNTETVAPQAKDSAPSQQAANVNQAAPQAEAAPSPQPGQEIKPTTAAPAAPSAPVTGVNPQASADAKNAPAGKPDKDLSKEQKSAAPEPEAAPLPLGELARRQPEDKAAPLATPPLPVTSGSKPPPGPQRRERDFPTDSGVATDDDAVARQEVNKRENRAAGAASSGRGPSKSKITDTDGLVASKPAAPATDASAAETDEETADNALKAKKRAAPPATRNAGGRSFVRRGNVWIDTACANRCATTTLRRGTDAYKRADAGLRSVADQLGGEVVVVWQGKAYRIQ